MNYNMLLTDGASVQNFIHCYSECPYNSLAISYHQQHLHISIYLEHQYQYPRGSTTLTIVMQSSMEIHNTITYLYNLIHLTSIGDAAALLWSNGHCHMISGGGDGSEETFHVP